MITKFLSRLVRLLFPFTLLALTACSVSGNLKLKDESQASIEKNIVIGMTKKVDVKAQYGEPATVLNPSSDTEIYIYRFSRASPWAINFVPIIGLLYSGVNLNNKELIVTFNQGSVATKAELRSSNSEAQRGLVVQ